MGDCRMRILISKDIRLLPADNDETSSSNNSSPWQRVVTRVYSADTTVREVVDEALIPLVGNTDVCLWDCTRHPPMDITNWPKTLYPDTAGPKSKTLYNAGWFPSGTWQALPKGQVPQVSSKIHDDAQYNLPEQLTSTDSESRAGVQLVATTTSDSSTSVKPSEVLQSVADRFQNEPEVASTDLQQALQVRRQHEVERRRKERARHAKLEARLEKLRSRSKTKNEKVSVQVQKMLLKSRCTGSTSLKVQDRVYLHVVAVVGSSDDDEGVTREEYRYFSRQDTVARIVSALMPTKDTPSGQQVELLVRWKGDLPATCYRRLPVTMRLYEAIEMKCLEEVDSVVLRCFSPTEEDPTTSILEAATDNGMEEGEEDQVMQEAETTTSDSHMDSNEQAPEQVQDSRSDLITLPEYVVSALQALDGQVGKSKKKPSATLEKVRTMKLKSKAKGDVKRLPEMQQRFFLELVVVTDDGASEQASTNTLAVFLARSDPVGRLLRDCLTVPAGYDADILVVQAGDIISTGQYRIVRQETSFDECETNGILKCFDRAIIHLHK